MRFVIIILIAFIFSNCRGTDKEADEIEYGFSDTILVWETNTDSMIMKRDRTIPDSVITINRVINGLNEKYPEVQLVFLRQSNDTVYTRVPNSDYLGEQMGSAGASAWFDDAVINLTSVPGINYVSFSMNLQSHAGSSVISREKYNNWKRQ
ncbi:MAG TPA: hypothetical protein VJ765_09945 [Chitinophagaceae bacterium]|nr:hypothetical protein [Chitinophagaceae bacterium]